MQMYKYLIAVVLFIASTSAYADHYYRNVTITAAGIYGSNGQSILFVDFNGDKTTMTACAATKRLAINSSAPHFKEMVAIAFTAYAKADNKVDILVNESCNYWSNAEDLAGIKMGNMPW
jgi:hypothetical protein